jgi:hypothetical protein
MKGQSREHVVCSRQLHGGGNRNFLSEHVVAHTSRFFYEDHQLVQINSSHLMH